MMITVKAKNNTGRNMLSHIKGDTYYVPVVDGKEYSHIAETEDIAIIIGLGIKYDGLNSRFATNACRMLRIDSLWAE